MTHYYIDIDIPGRDERLDIGPAASPSDLVYALAHALLAIKKHVGLAEGDPVPPFKARADERGQERDLTKAEQAAFTAALEQAFAGLEVRVRPTTEED
jgi:hypothetical protein